jgi:hypothetical protein
MTPEAAVATLGMLALRYAPRPMPWTDGTADDATRRATMLAWVEAMGQYAAQAVLAAVEQVCEEHAEWTPNLNEFVLAMQAQARRHAADQSRQRSLQAAYRCDGSGWLDTEGDGALQPCPRCNPFLRSEWQAGRLHDTGPSRDERRKAWVNQNGGMPLPCKPPAETGGLVSPVEGKALAWRAYAEAAAAEGRQPDSKAFRTWAAQQ